MCDEEATNRIDAACTNLVIVHIVSMVVIYEESRNILNPYRAFYKLTFWLFLIYTILFIVVDRIYNFNYSLLILILLGLMTHLVYFTTAITDFFDLDKEKSRRTTPKNKWEKM